MTRKEELIQTIINLEENQSIRTGEMLVTGEINRMTFKCSKEHLTEIINNGFNDELQGAVPGGISTLILSWEIIELN